MSVTDETPTRVGQRVEEIFSNTRGWVVDISTDRAAVDWDHKPEGLADEDDKIFPVDALRVVKHIAIDLDLYKDPSLHPEVESSRTEGDVTIYIIRGNLKIRGIEMMRLWLLGYHERA